MKTQTELVTQKEKLESLLQELTTAHQALAEQTELIEKRANYDILTDLPNRTLLKETFKTQALSCKTRQYSHWHAVFRLRPASSQLMTTMAPKSAMNCSKPPPYT